MGEYILGYISNEIIRQNTGSPASWWSFANRAEVFMIQNLGSNSVYYCIDSVADPASSGTAVLLGNSYIALDAIAGSISIQGSGVSTPQVQIIRLT